MGGGCLDSIWDVTCIMQVVFSSSVMYANFLTLAQRRAIAKEAEEHLARCAHWSPAGGYPILA